MTHSDTSDYMPVAFTFTYGEHSRSHTVYVEDGASSRDVMQTLSGCVNAALGELWREWNEFR